MWKASKLWTPGPQDSIFQHLLEPEAGPEGGIFWCLFRWLVCWTNFPKFMVEASKLRMLGPQDSIRVAGQILPLRDNKIRASFLGPVGPLWALPQIWPHHFIALCSAYFISKNQFSRPCSFRGDRATNNTFPCVLLYVGNTTTLKIAHPSPVEGKAKELKCLKY